MSYFYYITYFHHQNFHSIFIDNKTNKHNKNTINNAELSRSWISTTVWSSTISNVVIMWNISCCQTRRNEKSSKIYCCQAKNIWFLHDILFYLLHVRKIILACEEHSNSLLLIIAGGPGDADLSCSAAVTGLLRRFFPSQPQRGTVDLGALSSGLCRLAMHPPSLAGQALMDLRSHGEERPLHIIRALRTCLQEGDLQRRGQILERERRREAGHGGRNPEGRRQKGFLKTS